MDKVPRRTEQETRPAFWFNNVGKVEFINVKYPENQDEKTIVLENSGSFVKR